MLDVAAGMDSFMGYSVTTEIDQRRESGLNPILICMMWLGEMHKACSNKIRFSWTRHKKAM